MYKGSLFERLSPTEFNNKLYENDIEAYYLSIANNLSKIFSTNIGSSETVKDYGKPDLNNINLSMKESIEKIELFCEVCIKKYEPRLFRTTVKVFQEALAHNQMNVLIESNLFIKGKNEKVFFKADLLNNGKVKLYKNGI